MKSSRSVTDRWTYTSRDSLFRRSAIAAYLAAMALGETVGLGFGHTGRLGTTVHATTDNLITIEADEATQVSYTLVFRQAPHDAAQGGLLVITERFEDRLLKTDAGWLFAHRRMTVLHTIAPRQATAQTIGTAGAN